MNKPINYLDGTNVEYTIDLTKYYAESVKKSLSTAKINIKDSIRELKDGLDQKKFMSFKELAVIVALGVSIGCASKIGYDINQDDVEIQINTTSKESDELAQTQPIKRVNEDLIEIAKNLVNLPPEEADNKLFEFMMTKPDEFPDIFVTYAYVAGKNYTGLDDYAIDRGYKNKDEWVNAHQNLLVESELNEKEEEYKNADKAIGL